jgi:hypothetical protein
VDVELDEYDVWVAEPGIDVVGGVMVWSAVVVVMVTFTVDLHPNHPGEMQLVVVYVVVITGVVEVVVDDSSRQPHHPGVLQVVVLVYVVVLVVLVLVLVVLSLPLLSKNFQLKQSTHSSSGSHAGTVLYILSTLSITLWIL